MADTNTQAQQPAAPAAPAATTTEPVQVEAAPNGGSKKLVLVLIILIALIVGLALGWLLKGWLTPEPEPVDTDAIRAQAIEETKQEIEAEKLAQETAITGQVTEISETAMVVNSGDVLVNFTIDENTLFSTIGGDDGSVKTEIAIEDIQAEDFVSIKSDAVINTDGENYAQEIYKL